MTRVAGDGSIRTRLDLTIDDSNEELVDFSLHDGDHIIPATFWKAAPGRTGTPSLTMLQHGGPLHKRHDMSDATARTVRDRTGSAVLLIDGPIHGRRRDTQLDIMEMMAVFKRYWRDDAGIDRFVQDWKLALDAVLDRGWADPDRVCWLGLSMGTAYGIPVCMADLRIKAAAFGMWGTDWGQEARLLHDARLMRSPILFQIKSEDEIFSTARQRTLFDALGSPDKRLSTFAGGHNVSAPGQLDELLEFIAGAFDRSPGRPSQSAIDVNGLTRAVPKKIVTGD